MFSAEGLHYIVQFLAQQALPHQVVGYTANRTEWKNYRLVVIPSGFFNDGIYGTPQSAPQLPLKQIASTPLLFGEAKTETIGTTLVVHADLIASTFFLLTRYEEIIDHTRDEHGRFPGKSSLPFRARFIHRPLADEYGQIFRQWLRQAGVDVPEPDAKFSHIYLTHDADKLAQFRNVRGFLNGLRRALKGDEFSLKKILRAATNLSNDPLYTFPWLFAQNEQVPMAETIVFMRTGNHLMPQDRPSYNPQGRDAQQLLQLCRAHNVRIGLHTSYQAGEEPQLLPHEKALLEQAIGQTITCNRHHYLRSCEPHDMQALIDAGITDDFTMGYADMAGFRLGTCRAIKWFNPENRQLTNLTLHPLAAMDCSLNSHKYMDMGYDDAFDYCRGLAEQTRTHGGELTLLWHNNNVADVYEYSQLYHSELYPQLLAYLR